MTAPTMPFQSMVVKSSLEIMGRIGRMRLPDFVCSEPSPVWNGHGFSLCFEDLVFGCAANLVTILVIALYSKIGANGEKQKVKIHLESTGLNRSLGVELLPALATFLTVMQIFQLFLFSYESLGSSVHFWYYLSSQFFAWMSTSWALHYHYEAVMAYYKVLHYWWLLRSFFYIPALYSILNLSEVVLSPDFMVDLVLFITSFTFGLLVLLNARKFSYLADFYNKELKDVTESLLDDDSFQDVKAHQVGNSVWQFLVFGWVTPLMDLGTTCQLGYDDLFRLPRDLDPKICSKRLYQTWDEEQKHYGHRQSLFRAIYLAYGWHYLGIGFIKICNDTLGFSGPLLLNAIVKSIDDGSEKNLHFGYWCALFMGIISGLRAFLGSQYTFLVAKLKLQLRASIITLIYRQALYVSVSERSFFSSGEIQTLMSVDAERTVNLCGSIHELWSLPLQMAAALILLYLQVKFAFLAGLLIIILLIPVNKMIASRISKASLLMMEAKDERVRKIGEILTNIRTIKMYVWEKFLLERVMEVRKEEVRFLGVRKYLDAWCVYFWATTPIVFSLFTFGLYYLLGHQLDAATVFTSLALFNMLISPLNSFPWVINGLIEASVSIKRLRKFLSCPAINLRCMPDEKNEQRCKELQSLEGEKYDTYAVVLNDADFTWAHDVENPTPVLRNISLCVSKGCITLVLGEVGAGKSSLFQAILGEMRCLRGGLRCHGSFGYVSQDPWIQSGTIRENILFGTTYQRQRYANILHACALDVDIERMKGKDLCIVGEHGFNLSGGQRSRLALARALYQDCDILLLDDPLSAVDAHVASWLLEHAIKGPLMSKKTIILSTYNTQAISVADMVVLMEAGCIKWAGSILDCKDQLLRKGNDEIVATKMGLIDHYIESLHLNPGMDGSNSVHGNQEIIGTCQENPLPLVEDESRVQGAVQTAVYWIYASFIGWRWVALILFSTAFMQISRNGSDFWLSVWVDAASSDKHSGDFTYLYLIVFFGIAMANSIFTCARAFSFAYGGLSATFKVHKSLLERVISAPIQFFDHNPKGRILNRFSSDQYAVDDSLPFIANILLANAFSLLGIIIIFCIMQWRFLVLLVPLSWIYVSLQKYYRSTSRELRRLDSTSRSPVYSSFVEALDGSITIRAFGLQGIFTAKNEDHVALNQRASYSEIAASLWLSIRLQLLAACVIFFISMMAFIGREGRPTGNASTAGLVGLGLSYATPIISLLSDLLSTFTETEKEMVSVERIQEYMEIPKERNNVQSEASTDWPMQGSIHFDQVTLLYGPSLPPALKMVSFFLQGGTQAAIAGRTGAGKSSILNVLFGLAHATTGRVLIDDIDIENISPAQLRASLSIVPQRPFLFQGTLRDNLDPHGKLTDLRIWETLTKCHLKEIVSSFGGLGMDVKEGGESFSLGQCQLLCLARSLLKPTKVLCLDECTANVDPLTTHTLQRTIASECHGMTVITIAHRMASILDLDRVLILDHGELVEDGNPHDLVLDPASKFSSFVKASIIPNLNDQYPYPDRVM